MRGLQDGFDFSVLEREMCGEGNLPITWDTCLSVGMAVMEMFAQGAAVVQVEKDEVGSFHLNGLTPEDLREIEEMDD